MCRRFCRHYLSFNSRRPQRRYLVAAAKKRKATRPLNMSGAGSGSVPKRPKNPLLYGADMGFPFDNLQGSAILMPIAHEETSEPIAGEAAEISAHLSLLTRQPISC
jgi:hypothetical protein